jgi:type IV secretory pathway TraG/TraD family ATPase VirD4
MMLGALLLMVYVGEKALPLAGLLFAAAVVTLRSRRQETWDAYGTARWADEKDFKAAGMRGPTGLILGRVGKKLLRLPPERATHLLTVGPTGCGKGASTLVPNLLSGWVQGAAYMFDPKFELYALTADWRRAQGHTAILLDPLGMTGEPSHGFNVFAGIDRNSPKLIEEARALAEALILRPAEGEKDPHWNNAAALILTGFIALSSTRPSRTSATSRRSSNSFPTRRPTAASSP